MSPAILSAILTLIEEGIQVAPTLIADIEALIAAAKAASAAKQIKK